MRPHPQSSLPAVINQEAKQRTMDGWGSENTHEIALTYGEGYVEETFIKGST
jgi:hypothetical protein